MPSVYPGLWDTQATGPALMERASPVMEDSSLQNYYRQGRRFSHAPSLYQDWHDPRINRYVLPRRLFMVPTLKRNQYNLELEHWNMNMTCSICRLASWIHDVDIH